MVESVGLAALHTVEAEARRSDWAAQVKVGRRVDYVAGEEEARHNGPVGVLEVRRNVVEEEVAAGIHHKVVEIGEDLRGEDNGREVADTRLAEGDIVQEEVVDNHHTAAVVGDIGHNLVEAAVLHVDPVRFPCLAFRMTWTVYLRP
jgi:hypothetical protein